MALDMEKLRKLLLVVLSSDQAGEVMAASAAIAKALKRDGKDIHWLAKQIGQPAPQPAPPRTKPSATTVWTAHWIDQIIYCGEHAERLFRKAELEFIESMTDQYLSKPPSWQPSLRQRDWLDDIYTKLKTLEKIYE